MKSFLEYKLEEIANKLDEILRAVKILHDSVLQLNTVFEVTNTRMNERELLSVITSEIGEKLDKFKAKSSETCSLKDACARRMEKISFRILQVIAKSGVEEGLKEIRKQFETAEKYREICKDYACMKNAVEMFKSLEKIIEGSLEKQTKNLRKELTQNFNVFEVREEIAEKLSSISNPIRIRILKVLAMGKKSYAELERITSIRGGHLHFHLKILIKSGYVTQETPQGKYMLTNEGLKIFKLLYQLGKL
ncbi:MAG: winged helix-turn-helix domain-containing protein [Archaeoglobaceae archaeon]